MNALHGPVKWPVMKLVMVSNGYVTLQLLCMHSMVGSTLSSNQVLLPRVLYYCAVE